MASTDLRARVARVGFVPLSATGFRHVAVGADARSGLGAKIHGGRWNPPESWLTLYLGLSRATVKAEWERAARRQGLRLDDFLPRDLHEFDVDLGDALDLRSVERRRAVGLSERDVRAESQDACRRIGMAVHALGAEGVAAPSATGEGEILAIFLDQLRPTSRIEVRFVETWED
ncbi:MAG TPA: RES family NAD+ phosphorylase [Gaiellaceae bacterium]